MAITYTAIATVTVTSATAANIEFANIPQTYTDLVVKLSGRTSGTNATGVFQFNTDTTAANYQVRWLGGSGSSASSGNSSNPWFFNITQSTDTSNTFSNVELYIPNYTGTTQKSLSVDSVTENNSTAVTMNLFAGLWNGTSAITSIKLDPFDGDFVQYSTATLYGIKNTV